MWRFARRSCLRLVVVLVPWSVQLPAQTPTPSPTPSPPAYQQQRYDEDWSYLSDGGRRTDPLDELKYIRLTNRGWYVSLGGEARVRYEYFNEFAFGAGPQDSNGYVLQRYLLHADWHLGKRLRVFTQLQSGIETGRKGGPRPTDDDRLEVHQAFVDLKLGDENQSLVIRLGRHEMDFGGGRLISSGEGLNVRRSFDGVRLIWKSRSWIANGQFNKLVSVKQGIFNDTADPTQTFWGIGITRARPKSRGGESLYYIGLDRKRGRFDRGVGRETRHTLGLRSSGQFKAFDYNLDAILQFGSFNCSGNRSDIRAWAFSSDSGDTVSRSALRPRIGLRADFTSGDKNPNDHRLQTFNPLLPGTTYSDTIGLLGAANSIALFPNLRLTPEKKLTIVVGSAFFWRESKRDGIYGINASPLRAGRLSRARFVGALPSFRLDWAIKRHWSYTLILSRFQTGDYLKEAPPGKNTNYATTWLTFRF
ncbi:MAG: alginate export family protein [Pyrinomonadaceae bacterium]